MKKAISIILLAFAGAIILNGFMPKNIESSLEKEEKKELPVIILWRKTHTLACGMKATSSHKMARKVAF